MPLFQMFFQFPPITLRERDENGDELNVARLVPCGTIEAPNGDAALAKAKTLTRFSQRSKSSLMHYPIIEKVPNEQNRA